MGELKIARGEWLIQTLKNVFSEFPIVFMINWYFLNKINNPVLSPTFTETSNKLKISTYEGRNEKREHGLHGGT